MVGIPPRWSRVTRPPKFKPLCESPVMDFLRHHSWIHKLQKCRYRISVAQCFKTFGSLRQSRGLGLRLFRIVTGLSWVPGGLPSDRAQLGFLAMSVKFGNWIRVTNFVVLVWWVKTGKYKCQQSSFCYSRYCCGERGSVPRAFLQISWDCGRVRWTGLIWATPTFAQGRYLFAKRLRCR